MAKSTIKKFLRKGGQSLTAIAKGCFHTSKANATCKSEVNELIEAGELSVDTTGRFDIYQLKKAASKSVGKTKSASKKNALKKPGKATITAVTLEGYSVKQSRGKTVISCPNGASIPIAEGEYLVVINDDPRYTAKDAKDVISCIADYSTEKGMASFVVSDIKTNKVITGSDDISLDESRILSLQIKKHNKAA